MNTIDAHGHVFNVGVQAVAANLLARRAHVAPTTESDHHVRSVL